MNVLIFGQFSNNRGDEAAGRGMIRLIKDKLPNSKIIVCYMSNNQIPVLVDECMVTNIFLKSPGAISNIAQWVFCYLADKLNISIKSDAGQLIKLIKKSDVFLLSPGGPYIGDLYDIRSELKRLVAMKIAQCYGKKTMVFGPSMGPFKKYFRNLCRKEVLKKATSIIVRDSQSYGYVRALQLSNINLACDIAFAQKVEANQTVYNDFLKKSAIDSSKKIVGVTHMNIGWHSKWGKDPYLQNRFDNHIAHLCDNLISEFNCQIVLIPQIYGIKNDLPAIERLVSKIKNKDDVNIMDISFDSEQQQCILSRFHMVIGSRHHSIVLATKMGVPSICIAYEFKIESYMKSLGLEKYVFPIDNINFNVLKSTAYSLMKDPVTYLSILQQSLPSHRSLIEVYGNELQRACYNLH
jgi:polysaccharide pyruvyl transferase WcaK-like protein